MKTIKNFEGFKKSLLVATNGTMEETFDSSVLFSGCEYHSYRVYVDAIHYYNMFVIHNIATNTYDVALETTCCGTSTMSRKIKTQKSLIENMDNLTSQKKLNLISDCIAAEDSVGKLHIDIRKMYAYLSEQAVNAETSSDIKYLEIAKISLDFLVRGVLK